MGISPGYGPPPSRDEGIAIVRTAVEGGVTFFDKAEAYVPFTNEELLDEALALVRDQAVPATKAAPAIRPRGGRTTRASEQRYPRTSLLLKSIT